MKLADCITQRNSAALNVLLACPRPPRRGWKLISRCTRTHREEGIVIQRLLLPTLRQVLAIFGGNRAAIPTHAIGARNRFLAVIAFVLRRMWRGRRC